MDQPVTWKWLYESFSFIFIFFPNRLVTFYEIFSTDAIETLVSATFATTEARDLSSLFLTAFNRVLLHK